MSIFTFSFCLFVCLFVFLGVLVIFCYYLLYCIKSIKEMSNRSYRNNCEEDNEQNIVINYSNIAKLSPVHE